MIRRALRVAAIAILAVLAIVVIGLLVLHTNPVQARVLDWAVRELEQRFSLDLAADDLHYNLFARRVTMTGVRLAAVGHRDEPFFSAERVSVRLPWAAYLGRLHLDEVAIDDGQVAILRDAAGISNLPPGGEPRDPNAPPRRLDIRGITIRGLDVVYRDLSRELDVRAPGLRTEMTWEGARAVGPLAIARPVTVEIGERRVTVQPITGAMSFDGSNVGLENVALDTSEGEFRMSGELQRALDQLTLDLRFDGTTDLSRVEGWTSPPVHLGGTARIAAHMTGPPGEFVLDTQVVSEAAEVGRARGVRIEAHAQLTSDSLSVPQSIVRPATGGQIEATVELAFGEDGPWRITAKYAGLDAETAFRLADIDPLPFGASLAGTATIDRAAGEPFVLDVRNTSSPRAAPGKAPLDGRVRFVVDGNRWRAEQSHRVGTTEVIGPLGGTWNREQVVRSTFDGTLAVTTGDVGEAVRYASLFGFDTPGMVQQIRGPLTADVQVGGVFASPEFSGTLQSDRLVVPMIGEAALSAGFVASERAVGATDIDGVVGSTTVRGDMMADLASRRLDGALQLRSPDVGDLMEAVPDALRLRGLLTAQVSFGGSLDEPDISAEATGRDLTLGGQPVDALFATARIVEGGVDVEQLRLEQSGTGVLQAKGRYEWERQTFSADVDGKGLHWEGRLGGLGDASVRFDLAFAGSGPIDRPAGEGRVEFAVAGGVAGQLIDRGIAELRLDGDTALVTGHIPSLGAFIRSRIVPRDPFAYEAVVVMNRIDLQPVFALSGMDATQVIGLASLSARAEGTLSDVTASEAFVNLQEIDATVAATPIALVAPARVSWDGAALAVDELDLKVGQGRLNASGRLGLGGVSAATWASTFEGDLGDLLQVGRAFGVPDELQGNGPLSVEWRSAGGIDDSTASLHLERGSLGWGALPAVRDFVIDAAFDGTTLTITQFTGQWQDGGIEGTASIPRAVIEAAANNGTAAPPSQPGFAKLRVSGLTEEALAPWLDKQTLTAIDGRLSATLDARMTGASLEDLEGTLTIDEAEFTIAGVEVRQQQASIVELADGVLTPRQVTFVAGGSPVTLTGSARLAPADARTLALELDGTIDLRILSAFAPALATDGDAVLDLGIGGTMNAPVFSGGVAIKNAEIALREPRIIISQLNGTIALDGQRVVFDAFSGTLNGGAMVLDGGFLLDSLPPSQGALTVVVEGAALDYPAGLQSESNAIVTLRPGPAGWSLTGDISVLRSAYAQPISLAALLAADAVRAPSADGEAGWAQRLRLNLWVTTQQDLVVDTNYGRFEAGAALRVIGSVGEPVLAGRVSLSEGGEVYLAGNTFRISRGSISFTNPFRIVPEFDIELRTIVSGTDIILTIDGPPERLRTDVRSSDPTVDSREALSMIFGGLEGEDALTLLSGELLGATGRVLGLDTLRVERRLDLDEFRADPGLIATETDPSTRLTFSKRLRPDVELIFSQSLRESGGLTAIISYRPRSNIELRGISRDGIQRAVALRHEITFGGRGTVATADAAPPPQVSDITISGDPQRPIQELLAYLELREGEPFSFHEWQQDIDRLRRVYHDRHHYEARVRGMRSLSDDGKTVSLNYDITPGPVTELVIEGHPLDSRLEEEIRETWRRTIFDRFLLEDIRARILRHLLEENIVGVTVDAEVALSTPERKVVRVNVSSGVRVGERRFRYDGANAYDAQHLNRVVANAGLAIDGWLDPPRVADALTDFYRSEGYLDAVVQAGQPLVLGNTAVLPFEIVEGRRFVIDAVSFPGVSPERVVEVTSAARLSSGQPFVAADVDEARRRVEAVYARRGFNTVQMEVDVNPDDERGTVDVMFAVVEGPQQVLVEVTTQGATRTDEDVVRRALRLRLGEPVNLGDWAQARKRLYDTNVFRQVDIEPVPLEPTAEQAAQGIQPVRAAVRVVEYPVWRLRYGAQFNDEQREVARPDGDARMQSIGLLADLQNQNLFGRAVTAGIAGRYERERQAGNLFTSNSTFFGLPIRSSGFVFTSRQRFQPTENFEYIDQRVGVTAEQRWRPFRLSEVIWSYRFERSHTYDPDVSPGDLIPLDVVVKVSRVNAAMFFDRRDDPTNPTRGWFNSFNYEQAIVALGSDFGHARVLAQQSAYRNFGAAVLAGRVQLGAAFGEEPLIVSERFQLGGGTTVRGYAENSLGPQDDLFGLPGGGDALLNLNGEIRFPIRGWLHGVGFVDAGNVFERRSDLSFDDLFVGYGFGLRLVSPFALLRVDFGIPGRQLPGGRPANRLSSGRWYFGVGHIF